MKVLSDLTVYHVPGFKQGLELNGWEALVDSNVTEYKGTMLSPNHPWRLQLEVESRGRMRKFYVHVVRVPTCACHRCHLLCPL